MFLDDINSLSMCTNTENRVKIEENTMLLNGLKGHLLQAATVMRK